MRALLLTVGVLTVAAAVFALWPRDAKHSASACGPVDAKPSQVGLLAAGQTTLCLINRERTTRGLTPLRQNRLLDSASVEHSRDMVERGYFEHTSPDGRSVGDRLRAVGYSRGFSASAGENIAYGVGAESTPGSIVKAWMDSPPHRRDILRPVFSEIGIGIALGGPEGQSDAAIYTTDFGGAVDPSLPNG